MRFPRVLLAVYLVAFVASSVTYFAGLPPAPWLVALARSGHPPAPWLELTLVFALWQACLGVPACMVGAFVLLGRDRPGVAVRGDPLRVRLRHGLWGGALLLVAAAWLTLDLACSSLHASMSWVADGLTLAALIAVLPGVAFVIDAAFPLAVFEGAIAEHVQFGRDGRADYFLRIAGHRVEVPRGVWEAVPDGAHVRVTRWGFSDRFVALERL